MSAYLLSHWRGQQSLVWSFWINLISLRVLLFVAQSHWIEAAPTLSLPSPTVIYLLVLLAHGVLLLWQVVGVVRACDHHFAENGSMATLWGAQLAAVVLFLMSAAYALEAVQLALKPPESENVFALIRKEHAAQYDISFSDDKCEIRIDGLLALGITKAVNRMLLNNADVRTVVLNSDGGNIYEGRGLAKLFADKNLNTRVSQQCASACTLAYIGGTRRTAVPGARFGFHQYRVDADYDIIATDVAKEQARDRSLFLNAGVSDSFTERMFSQVSSGMWWPELKALETAGVLQIANQACIESTVEQ